MISKFKSNVRNGFINQPTLYSVWPLIDKGFLSVLGMYMVHTCILSMHLTNDVLKAMLNLIR